MLPLRLGARNRSSIYCPRIKVEADQACRNSCFSLCQPSSTSVSVQFVYPYDNKIMKSQFCLTSTASFEQINRASTNRSRTKQTFSFSKGNRFPDSKPMYCLYHSAVPSTPMEGTLSLGSPQQQVLALGGVQTSPNVVQSLQAMVSIPLGHFGMRDWARRKELDSPLAEM